MISHSFDELINDGYNNFKDVTGIYEKINGKYVGKTFGEFYTDVQNLSRKLIGMKYKNIMLYGKNSYNWLVVYLATTAYAGIVVPIDKDWKDCNIINALSVTEIDCIFYSNHLGKKLDSVNIPKIDLANETTELISQGCGLDIELEVQNPSRVCATFFTSGTTSSPRKVGLTEKNFFANGDCMAKLVSLSTKDRYMLSLPLSHIGSIWASFIGPIEMGASLYIPNDYSEIAADMKLIRPTVLYGVPRVFEKLCEKISPKAKKIIGISNLLCKLGIDIRKTIFSELHNNLGGALRFAYSGAAKLDNEIIHMFHNMGLVIMQGYGMTETTALISCDSIKNYKLGSVGKVLANQSCKIIDPDEDGVGEICVKGDNIAACAVNDDGYLHTGDTGYVDEDGYLFFIGRKKRMIKFSNAKNIYPDEIEKLLLQNDEIQRALVYEENGLVAVSIVSNCHSDTINSLVEELNETMPYYMRIASVAVSAGIETLVK